jgi:hypothetical protein
LGDVDSAVLDLRNAIELWRAIGMENDQNSLQSQANLVNALLHTYTENTEDSSHLDVELRQRVGRLVEGASKCEPDHHLKAWLAKVEQQYPELFVV